jgi:hypothetical protein
MSVKVSVRLDPGAIRSQLTGPNAAIAQDLMKRGQRVLNAAKRNCPVDEGRLRASLAMEMSGSGDSLEVKVGSNLKYAIYVEKGTGVYAGKGYITPKNGRFLVWPNKNNSGSGNRRYSGGRTSQYVFARRVKGQRAQPYLEPALAAAR